MARFDVFRTANGKVLLDCQSDVLNHLSTRFVVPLMPTSDVPKASRLNPVFFCNDEKMVMATQLASAVGVRDLGTNIANLDSEYFTILDALDMMISGY
jgi:toxin CcdB